MVPFIDLKTQYLNLKNEIDDAIAAVLNGSSFILGPAVASFEEKFAAYIGTRYASGVNSGTSALHLALLAAGVGPGDEVIVPAMTFVATASAVEYAGARPVLVDVDPVYYTLDPERLEAAITPKTRAVMPVHLYGQSADMDPILEIARRYDLVVIEDAAQSHGGRYKGRRLGTFGDLAAFSFYPGKNLGAFGEGGAVVTDREDLAATVAQLRDWGQKDKGRHDLRGFNYRMEGLQGAVLGVKMDHIEEWTEARRRAADRYAKLLEGEELVATPAHRGDARHVCHVYAVRVAQRERVRSRLSEAGIASGIHYPLPVHLQPCFADLGYGPGDFPVAEKLAEEELSLPMFPELTAEQQEEVTSVLSNAVQATV